MAICALKRFDVALQAYRCGNFYRAIDELTQLISGEPGNWEAVLYLAMSYYKVGNAAAAVGYFGYIKANCLDLQIKARADLAFRNTTLEIKKPAPNNGQIKNAEYAKTHLRAVPSSSPATAASSGPPEHDWEAESLELVNTTDDYYR